MERTQKALDASARSAVLLLVRSYLATWALFFAAVAVVGLCCPTLVDSEARVPPTWIERFPGFGKALCLALFLGVPAPFLRRRPRVLTVLAVAVMLIAATFLVYGIGKPRGWLEFAVLIALPIVLKTWLIFRALHSVRRGAAGDHPIAATDAGPPPPR